MVVNNKKEKLKVSPFVSGKYLYCSLREVCKHLGYEISKAEEKKLTFFTLTNQEVEVVADANEIKINTTSKKLPDKVQLIKGEIFIPLREVLLYLGINTEIIWKEREIYLYPQIKRVYQNPDLESFTIEFTADAPLSFDVKKLTQPLRLVIDIPYAYVGTHPEVIEVRKGAIEKIRCSQYQFTPYPIARYVVDLTKSISHSISLSDKGNEIYLEFPHQVINIAFKREEDIFQFEIITTGKVKYKYYSLPDPDRIVFDLYETVMSYGPEKTEIPDNSIISVRVSQFSVSPLIARVVIDTSEKFEYNVSYDEKTQKLICNILTYVVFLKDKKIVLDAGHGGRDPGAISTILGLKEKDLNLDIVKKLQQLLTKAGAKVYLTRGEDIFVSLDERVSFAEEKNTDIFVSIHCNALPSDPLRRGTRTYYYNENSKYLAEIIQSNLVEEIQTTNEGIKTAGFVVIKKTTSPSVLVEVAYLTNEEDEKLLSDEEFRKRVAGGIYKGIKSYFKKQEKNE